MKAIQLSKKAIQRYNSIADDIDKGKRQKMTRKDISILRVLIKDLNLPKTSYEEREKRYSNLFKVAYLVLNLKTNWSYMI